MVLQDSYPAERKMSAEVCKPDYERLIKEETERLGRVSNLRDAIFTYIGDTMHVQSSLAEMVGELTLEGRYCKSRISNLIKEQEQNS